MDNSGEKPDIIMGILCYTHTIQSHKILKLKVKPFVMLYIKGARLVSISLSCLHYKKVIREITGQFLPK